MATDEDDRSWYMVVVRCRTHGMLTADEYELETERDTYPRVTGYVAGTFLNARCKQCGEDCKLWLTEGYQKGVEDD